MRFAFYVILSLHVLCASSLASDLRSFGLLEVPEEVRMRPIEKAVGTTTVACAAGFLICPCNGCAGAASCCVGAFIAGKYTATKLKERQHKEKID